MILNKKNPFQQKRKKTACRHVHSIDKAYKQNKKSVKKTELIRLKNPQKHTAHVWKSLKFLGAG